MSLWALGTEGTMLSKLEWQLTAGIAERAQGDVQLMMELPRAATKGYLDRNLMPQIPTGHVPQLPLQLPPLARSRTDTQGGWMDSRT